MLRAYPFDPDRSARTTSGCKDGGMAGLGDSTTIFVTTDDGVPLATSVRESDRSTDAPTLLLVHGFGGAKEDFADHVDALAREHRVVSFDHRGHGASGAP